MKTNRYRARGFTIVELLISVAVIGILISISIIAYNGVQNNARRVAALSDLDNASSTLEHDLLKTGTYPATIEDANNGEGLEASEGTTYQYTVNNSATPPTFCLTATNVSVSYYISSSVTTSSEGGCPGHGVDGAAPITNLVLNPRGVGSSSGWFVPLSSTYVTVTPNVSWNGRSDWYRYVWNGTNYSTTRLLLNLSDLVNGQTYTASLLLGNSGTSSISGTLDFCDMGATSFTLQPGESRRIYFSASRSTYDNIYRFLDINPGTGSSGVLVTNVMVTEGTTQYSYADGSTPTWVWNGTPYSSTSTGPAL